MSKQWSAPDDRDIITLDLNVGAKRTMRGKRRRRSNNQSPASLAMLAQEQKDLIKDWIKGTSSRRKWNNLLSTSGFANVLIAEELLGILLESGWVEVEEHRTGGTWDTVWVDFLAFEELREHLGLTNREKEKAKAANLQGHFTTEAIQIAVAQLDTLPVATKIKRHQLLAGLEEWIQEGLQGTRRDFSLFVRGRTKDITTAEWDWLESQLDLTSFGISVHTPLIRIKIPGTLVFPEGQLDFRCLPGFVALTQEQIAQAMAFSGDISCWKVVENLTSFERVVHSSLATEGVIWVPGFAPSWWRTAAANLVSITKAPGKVACDPDPAGLLIASQVGEIWDCQKVVWDPWCMSQSDFVENGKLIPLTEHDVRLLTLFKQRQGNHVVLMNLAKWMETQGLKLEQESFVH